MASGQLANSVRASRKLKRFSTWIALGAAVIAMPLGFWGFKAGCTAIDTGFWAALLQTFQLYFLNVEVDSLCNNNVWVAAFIAPVATLSALLAVFSHTATTWWRRGRLWMQPPKTVFLGGGKNATSIALQKYPKEKCRDENRKESVVFVDSSETPLIHEHLDRLGCKICDWYGDALSGDVLKSVNAYNAEHVWVLTGDDRRNIEIAQALATTSANSGRENQMVMANVDDQELIRDVSFAIGEHPCIRFFSIKKLAARYLFRNYSPKLPFRSEGVVGEKANQLHIAIIGSGDMIDALVEQAIVHFVYSDSPKDCVKITLFGRNALARMEATNYRLPSESAYSRDEQMIKLLPIVELAAIDCVPSRIKYEDWKDSQSVLPFDAVYVNDNVDLNTIAWATRAAAMREIDCRNKSLKIVACLSQAFYEDAAFSKEAVKSLPENVQVFSVFDCISTTDSYPGEAQDGDAMLINLAYDVYDVDTFNQMDLLAAKIRATEKWGGSTMDKSLAEMFRRSSRFAADHILLKLAKLYPDMAGEKPVELYNYAYEQKASGPWSSEPDQPPGEKILDLMELEHRRFVVERLVDGWLPTDVLKGTDREETKKKMASNKKLRLNDTLVPFDELPPDQKLKDRLIVECIPKILELRKRWKSDTEK